MKRQNNYDLLTTIYDFFFDRKYLKEPPENMSINAIMSVSPMGVLDT